jgi:hypothetical protein
MPRLLPAVDKYCLVLTSGLQSGPQQLVNGLTVRRKLRNAKLQSNLGVLPRSHLQAEVVDAVLRLPSESSCLALREVFEQVDELIAGYATQHPRITDYLAQQSSNLGQHSVPGLIAISLIDRSKPGDVKADD